MRILESNSEDLMEIYRVLLLEFGHQKWWPADTQLETIVGIVLTQNVSWKNASLAIGNLKNNGLMQIEKILHTNESEIACLIKSSRYYNLKAKRLKNIIQFIFDRYNGNIELMCLQDQGVLRNQLLQIKGLGQESVDSILLYVCSKPIFVIDAYTKRIISRLGYLNPDQNYADYQNFFMKNLPQNVNLFKDYHAQIVRLGNEYCNKNPKCHQCPLNKYLKTNCKF